MRDSAMSPLIEHNQRQLGEEETPKCKNTRKAIRGKVTFVKSLAVVKPTLKTSDYSPDEILASWYDQDEIKTFKMCRREIAKRMDKGMPLDYENDCTRGLEFRTKKGFRHRHFEILGALNAVLDEQDSQDQNGFVTKRQPLTPPPSILPVSLCVLCFCCYRYAPTPLRVSVGTEMGGVSGTYQ
jgi:hypothetical protein